MRAISAGQDKMGKMKAILEQAEQHLQEKAGQYSERGKPSAEQKLLNRSPSADRPELQEGTSNTANASELFEAASNSFASSDSSKHCPVAVGLTVHSDFDKMFRSAASISDFNR